MKKMLVTMFLSFVLATVVVYASIKVYEFYSVDWTATTVTVSSSSATQIDASPVALDNRLAFLAQNISATNKIWCKHNDTVAIDDGFVLLPYSSMYLPITTKKYTGGAIMTMWCIAETADSKLTVVQAR